MKKLTRWIAGLALCASTAAAWAQVDKPLRLLVGFAPGASTDIAARLLAERMKDDLEQPVTVDNKPGAGGRIAAEMLKNAAADGATIMICPIVVPGAGAARLRQARLRPGGRLHAGRARRQRPVRAVGECQPSGAERSGADGLVQGQPGPGQLRHARPPQPAALLRRDARARRQGRPGGRALQRRRAADDDADRRPGRVGDRYPGRPS